MSLTIHTHVAPKALLNVDVNLHQVDLDSLTCNFCHRIPDHPLRPSMTLVHDGFYKHGVFHPVNWKQVKWGKIIDHHENANN